MNSRSYNYFVVAATVAAELYKAMLVAKEISLTASNARALALRAGQSAAGFRAITDFIDELAVVTVNASKTINSLASKLSKTAANAARAENALARFDIVYTRGKGARFLPSLDEAFKRTQNDRHDIQQQFDCQVNHLLNELDNLAKELRTATVLAAMSRVEASQTAAEFSPHLEVVANNVVEAADKIQSRVKHSQQLFSNLTKN